EKGASIPGAEVKLTDEGTNISSQLATNDSGQYSFPYQQAGTYTIAVTKDGFAPYRKTGIVVGATESIKVEVTLRVSQVQTTVDVSASAAQVQAESSSVQTAVQEKVISIVPNINQNPLYYAMLQAGVTPTVASQDTTSINSFGIGINGRRQYS